MNYPASVAVTWQTTIDQLTPGQLALLQLLAWFAAEPIPTWVFESADAEWVWRGATRTLPTDWEPAGGLFDALAGLAGFSMLRWDADSETVSVHRVVQQILRDRIGNDTARWVKHSAELLNAVLPDAPGDVRAWKRWEPLRPHVAAAIEHADQAGIAHPTSRLMNQLAQLLYAKALYPQAEPLMRRSLAIDEATYGPDDPEVATRPSNLAGLMLATNRLAPAEPLLRRALAIDEAHYGPDNPEVAIDLNNLTQLLMDTDRLGEAEPLMRRVWPSTKPTTGPTAPGSPST